MSANPRLSGKTALITGAARGIGRAIVEAFIAEGANVIATDRDEAAVKSLAAEIPAIDGHKLDVTDGEAIARLSGELQGPVHVLVNCAGFVHDGSILDCSLDDWEKSFSTNVTSAFMMSKAFLPRMLEAGQGSIVNIASIASTIKGYPRRLAYGASKAAMLGLTKAIAVEYVGQGIRCNAICPGTTESDSLRQRMADTGDEEQARRNFIARQPMGRLGRPEEMAALAVYLASDEAAFTTGAFFIADGGATL